MEGGGCVGALPTTLTLTRTRPHTRTRIHIRVTSPFCRRDLCVRVKILSLHLSTPLPVSLSDTRRVYGRIGQGFHGDRRPSSQRYYKIGTEQYDFFLKIETGWGSKGSKGIPVVVIPPSFIGNSVPLYKLNGRGGTLKEPVSGSSFVQGDYRGLCDGTRRRGTQPKNNSRDPPRQGVSSTLPLATPDPSLLYPGPYPSPRHSSLLQVDRRIRSSKTSN